MSKKILKKGFPGVLPLKGDYLFVDETEVSNIQWKEFLYWLKKHDTFQYNLMLPDTNVWRSQFANHEPFVKYYFQHPAYTNYPVVGITYNQALAYCKWRGDRVLEYLKLKNSPIKKLIYRLPTEEEWKQAAWGTLPVGSMWPWEGESVRWTRGKKRNIGLIKLNFNTNIMAHGAIVYDAGFITTPVFSYWENTIGLYNMCGNVAEWTEEHKAMGGSWNDYGYNCQITTPKPVLHDSIRLATLGFRCVMEIVEYEDEYGLEPLKLTAKFLEKQMKFIPDTNSKNWIFASETETSNQLYFTFLQETKNSDHAIQNQNWATYTRYFAQQLYGWHKAYSLYPVVNIDYEGATAYCEWLTNKYNGFAKRKYKKVQFRLPTQKEWEHAASAGKEQNTYPWGGAYTQNSKGCHIANFSPLELQYLEKFEFINHPNEFNLYEIKNGDTLFTDKLDRTAKIEVSDNYGFGSSYYLGLVYHYSNNDRTISRGVDGSYYPARVDTYYPNNYGLFNCAGNVSEMLSEKGKAKGGNWTSSQYQIQINSPVETYTAANPTLGFRVFMEVLEK